MPKTQQDDFSCGLWATKILLEVVMGNQSLENVKVGLTPKNILEHRYFLVRLMETRYLYVDGVFKDPIASEEEEEKKQERKNGNSVATAIAEDISDDKSDVSALTTKTNKTSRHTNKHCFVCKKNISGANWNKHVAKVHKGL
jgi:hypothetical protein